MTSFENLNWFLKVAETKSCSKWSTFVLEWCSCRCSTRINPWPLLFPIYISGLSDGLQCNPKLFAGDTSLFATVYNFNKATNDLNNDLIKITKWAFQWKMSFNPYISKQAHEVIFSHKMSITSHPLLTFNNIPVAETNSQKHLGMQLDNKLNFE